MKMVPSTPKSPTFERSASKMMAAPIEPAPEACTHHGSSHFKIGTLTYSHRTLFILSFWLLWGDLAFNFFESVFSRFIPIYLKELNASNTLIGLTTGSAAGMVNILFLPTISRWSDRFRSRLGRRIPFLLVATPITAICLILVGFAPEIGKGLGAAGLSRLAAEGTLILAFVSISICAFHFFNMVLCGGFNWLVRDVVPQEVMSRFLAWFRIVGAASGILFLWFVFPHLLTHRREIFLGVGVVYIFAFLLMCLKVKEGSYPLPEQENGRHHYFKHLIETYRRYFEVPLYRNYFIVNFLMIAALNCAGNFIVLYGQQTLAMDMGSMGHIFSWAAIASMLVYFPIGWVCDRLHPLFVTLAGIVAVCTSAILARLFVGNETSYLVYFITFAVPVAIWALGNSAATMKLFPAEQFGQLSSGINIFSTGAMIGGNFLIGLLMDLMHNDYRMAFVWTALLSACAVYPMLQVIRGWHERGGPSHYSPPFCGSEPS
jgi:maltose/moltooligosaccharide transporter